MIALIKLIISTLIYCIERTFTNVYMGGWLYARKRVIDLNAEKETITIYWIGNTLIFCWFGRINLHWWTEKLSMQLSDFIGQRCFRLVQIMSILNAKSTYTLAPKVIIARQGRRYFNWKLNAELAITQRNPIQSNAINVAGHCSQGQCCGNATSHKCNNNNHKI